MVSPGLFVVFSDVWWSCSCADGPICDEAYIAPYMADEAGVVFPLTTKLKLFWKFLKVIPRIIPSRPTVQAPKAEAACVSGSAASVLMYVYAYA